MSLALNDSHRNYWQRVENSVVQIIELAIDLMCAKSLLPKGEDELNREFYFCLVEANFILQKKDMGLDFNATYEALNQPALIHDQKEARENKRPDFQWSFSDASSLTFSESAKQFVLECKRLDKSTASWNFTDQYFEGGIKRFISAEHGYGFNVASSAMLGYVQSDDCTHFHVEVNRGLKGHRQTELASISTRPGCMQLSHILATEHSLKQIRLIHFWTEIQKFYSTLS